MIIKNPSCPTCGKSAVGTVERVFGVALFASDPKDGATEYAGETELNWDSQESLEHPLGGVVVTCDSGHEWASEIGD